MYLEISARRSGKTYRMIKEIEKQIFKGHKIVVVYPNFNMAKHLLPDYLQNCPYVSTVVAHTRNMVREIDNVERKKWFFEEFDFLTENRVIPIIKDGYYCTTVSGLRTVRDISLWKQGLINDSLLDLLKYNKGQSNSYSFPFFTYGNETINDLGQMLNKTTFAQEIGHQIFTN